MIFYFTGTGNSLYVAKELDFRKTSTEACEENRIPGVAKFRRMWLIPKDAEKPVDGRRKENKK